MAGGRPTEYNAKIAKRICDVVSTTAKGIRKICEMYPDIPNHDAIFEWRREYPEFAEQYRIAKVQQAELFAEDSVDISDDASKDFYTDEEGKTKVNAVAVARAKLRVDTRKWHAAKLAPSIYGDKPQDNSNDKLSAIEAALAKLAERDNKR